MSRKQTKCILRAVWHYALEFGLCCTLALSGHAWLYLLISLFVMAVIVGANSSK